MHLMSKLINQISVNSQHVHLVGTYLNSSVFAISTSLSLTSLRRKKKNSKRSTKGPRLNIKVPNGYYQKLAILVYICFYSYFSAFSSVQKSSPGSLVLGLRLVFFVAERSSVPEVTPLVCFLSESYASIELGI